MLLLRGGGGGGGGGGATRHLPQFLSPLKVGREVDASRTVQWEIEQPHLAEAPRVVQWEIERPLLVGE